MSAEIPVTIPRDATASLYTLWLGRALGSSSIECIAGDTSVTLKPETTATDIASFTFVLMDDDVTCRLGSAKQPPTLTQVQMTTQEGLYFDFDTWYHELSTNKEQLPIIIYAKIYFGGYPVIKANVTTVVTSGNRQESVKMLDNGRGDPDVTLFDGIYSGYFASFLEKGDYEIRVTINADEGRAKFMTHYRSSSVIDFCCGSVIMGVGNHVPAFWMDKLIVYNKRPEDGYPQSRILDLEARIFKSADTVTLTWTAPGGGKAVRYVLKLFENREDAVTKFETTGRALNARSMVPGDIGGKERFEIPFKDLDEDVTYYAAVRSRNEFNKSSEISNVAEFVPTQEKETTASSTPASTNASGNTTDGGIAKPDQTKNGNETIGIVLGVLGGIAALCILVYLGYYFFVKRPRRN